jgi:hypothetical protein
MILVAAVITAGVIYQYQDPAFTGVMVWAFVAIAIRQSAQTAILITALASAIALTALLFQQYAQRARNRPRGA